jgi:rhodanese-related sulfurtransferase
MEITLEKYGMLINGMRYVYGRDALELLNNGAVLVDLRDEFLKNGRFYAVPHIISISHKIIRSEFETLPKDKILILADYVGLISKDIAEFLKSNGFELIMVLTGGIIDWERDNMPISIDKDCELVGSCTCQLKQRKIKNSPDLN